jgi:hypothetical protein
LFLDRAHETFMKDTQKLRAIKAFLTYSITVCFCLEWVTWPGVLPNISIFLGMISYTLVQSKSQYIPQGWEIAISLWYDTLSKRQQLAFKSFFISLWVIGTFIFVGSDIIHCMNDIPSVNDEATKGNLLQYLKKTYTNFGTSELCSAGAGCTIFLVGRRMYTPALLTALGTMVALPVCGDKPKNLQYVHQHDINSSIMTKRLNAIHDNVQMMDLSYKAKASGRVIDPCMTPSLEEPLPGVQKTDPSKAFLTNRDRQDLWATKFPDVEMSESAKEYLEYKQRALNANIRPNNIMTYQEWLSHDLAFGIKD